MRMRFKGPWRVLAIIADVCMLLGIGEMPDGAVLLAIEFNSQF